MRGHSRSSISGLDPYGTSLALPDEDAAAHSTIRPPAASVPVTLRNLFDFGEVENDHLRLPLFEPPPLDNIANLSLSASPSPARGRSPARFLTTPEFSDDPRTAKQSTFVFPPRTSTPRVENAVGPNEPDPQSPLDQRRERLPPLGPGIPRILPSPSPAVLDPSSETITAVEPSRVGPSYRSVRTYRNIPDLDISNSGNADAGDSPPPIVLSASSPGDGTTTRPLMQRGRSKSSAAGLSSPPSIRAAGSGSSHVNEFRFPPAASKSSSPSLELDAPSPLPTFQLPNGHIRRSPTSSHGSTTVSPAVHQTTLSLDASMLPKRLASPGGSLATPPPMMRARSATATAEPGTFAAAQSALVGAPRPGFHRLASASILDAPSRPFTRRTEERSGSPGESSFSQSLGAHVPGLRDVLKVGPILNCYGCR